MALTLRLQYYKRTQFVCVNKHNTFLIKWYRNCRTELSESKQSHLNSR